MASSALGNIGTRVSLTKGMYDLLPSSQRHSSEDASDKPPSPAMLMATTGVYGSYSLDYCMHILRRPESAARYALL